MAAAPTDPSTSVRRLYGAALIASVGGLFFLIVRDLRMAGASLALGVGSALLARGAEQRSAPIRWGGYVCIGVAAALLIVDTLQTYLL